jgi:hypothetical protein
MKNFGWMTLVMIAASTSAFADGFKCEGLTFGTRIEMYHYLNPSQGTRNVNKMVVSNPSSQKGERTIATFDQDDKILIQKGATYIATVDSRFKTAKEGSKKIAGTTLGELQTIQVVVNFNYRVDTPSKIGQKYAALATYTKEDGSDISENMSCIRYKKN